MATKRDKYLNDNPNYPMATGEVNPLGLPQPGGRTVVNNALKSAGQVVRGAVANPQNTFNQFMAPLTDGRNNGPTLMPPAAVAAGMRTQQTLAPNGNGVFPALLPDPNAGRSFLGVPPGAQSSMDQNRARFNANGDGVLVTAAPAIADAATQAAEGAQTAAPQATADLFAALRKMLTVKDGPQDYMGFPVGARNSMAANRANLNANGNGILTQAAPGMLDAAVQAGQGMLDASGKVVRGAVDATGQVLDRLVEATPAVYDQTLDAAGSVVSELPQSVKDAAAAGAKWATDIVDRVKRSQGPAVYDTSFDVPAGNILQDITRGSAYRTDENGVEYDAANNVVTRDDAGNPVAAPAETPPPTGVEIDPDAVGVNNPKRHSFRNAAGDLSYIQRSGGGNVGGVSDQQVLSNLIGRQNAGIDAEITADRSRFLRNNPEQVAQKKQALYDQYVAQGIPKAEAAAQAEDDYLATSSPGGAVAAEQVRANRAARIKGVTDTQKAQADVLNAQAAATNARTAATASLAKGTKPTDFGATAPKPIEIGKDKIGNPIMGRSEGTLDINGTKVSVPAETYDALVSNASRYIAEYKAAFPDWNTTDTIDSLYRHFVEKAWGESFGATSPPPQG